MAKYQFHGETVHLGRFGVVKKGDIIDLTPHEESTILQDASERRFVAHTPSSKSALPDPNEGLPANFSTLPKEEQARLLKIRDASEADRRAFLAKQNAATSVERLREMTKEELLAHADGLRKQGFKIDEVPRTAGKREILNTILIGTGEIAKAQGEEE